MSTTLRERPAVTERPVVVKPPVAPKKPRKLVRWVEYAAIIAVIAGASVAAVLMLGDDEAAVPFDEAASPMIIGQRHLDPDFAVAPRMVFESDGTLADFEAVFDGFGTLYEAESLMVIGARHEGGFTIEPRVVYESDMTLADFEAVFDGFGTLYEAESPAIVGARHAEGFTVTPRMVFESDGTLEEFEASR
jgi:hypothetical protein